ncbi:MAG: polysaccharide pyruvyl transferase family protein [Clostridiales bacterium]|nr:polysaccharide pyruvyl transferase family protein [Clostridiales bacterium]
MKVAIISKYYKNYNFGGLLQAYALTKTIINFGIDAEQISYKANDTLKYGFVGGIKNNVKLIARDFVIRLISKNLSSPYSSMRKFMEEIPHTIPVTLKSIGMLNNDFDVFVAGSDQIWNPAFAYDEYFLSFVDPHKKRIAYAPSIGVSTLSEDDAEYLKTRAAHFDYISSREKAGVSLLKNIFPEKEIEWVLDPTFLLDRNEWNELDVNEKMLLPDHYALIYLMGNNDMNEKIAREIANTHGLKAITIPFTVNDYRQSSKMLCNLGPREFYTLIKHSNLVLTDSFHGTAFSIINNVPFCCFKRTKDSSNNMNSRIDSLFEMFDIPPRWISSETAYLDVSQDIDFASVNNRMSTWRTKSLDYLKTALFVREGID